MIAPGLILDGRYEVVGLIGEGAFAAVYEVRHTSLHGRHALKVLDPELAERQDLRNRFLAEGQIQAQLRHPHVVTVTDIVTDGLAGLVMEYVDGPTLDRHLAQTGPLTDIATVLELFLPILDGVGAAHAVGVVHRDLKPENILVARDSRGRPVPKVTDFGIAKVLDLAPVRTGKRVTHVAQRMGTLLYMSPEQVRSQGAITERSDIFALGAILYEVVTGRQAFGAKSEFDTMRGICEGEYEPPDRVVGGLHPVVGACIRKALAVDPAERFADCAAFRTALEGALQADAPLPVRPSRSYAVTEIPRRRTLTPMPAEGEVEEVLPKVPGMIFPNPGASPVLAFTLNLLCVTGLGQVYNGQLGKALLVFVVHLALAVATQGYGWPITLLLGAIDAGVVAWRLQRGEYVGRWQWF